VGISDSHGALTKADRLEITYARSEPQTQPDLVDERTSPTEATTIGSPEAPRIINRHRNDPKTKKVTTAALPKSKPKTTDIKRTAIPDRSKAASDTLQGGGYILRPAGPVALLWQAQCLHTRGT